ncbi:MAG: mycobacterial-type methylenetetrahydrofolate reductase [Thermoplasmata archaeon]
MGDPWPRPPPFPSAAPLLFEPVPPSSRLSAERAQRQAAAIVEVVAANPRIDAVNLPELVDENHDGRPYYRSGDVRAHALRLQRASVRPVIVNKVVAHLPDAAALVAWCRETIAQGIARAVLVGGSSRYIPYPGPPVIEADRAAAPIFDDAGGAVGNIAIPQRTGEAHRMLAKTRAGARFFTTQIVFDATPVVSLLTEYGALCREHGIPPAPVLLSLAPIADEGDVEFVRWLGADIPEAVEAEILNGGEAEPEAAADRSIRLAVRLYETVRDRTGRGAHPDVPLGLNVEQVSSRHLAHAARLAAAAARVLPDRALDAGPRPG